MSKGDIDNTVKCLCMQVYMRGKEHYINATLLGVLDVVMVFVLLLFITIFVVVVFVFGVVVVVVIIIITINLHFHK